MWICAGEVRAFNKTWHVHDSPWREPGHEGSPASFLGVLRFARSFSEGRPRCRCSVRRARRIRAARRKNVWKVAITSAIWNARNMPVFIESPWIPAGLGIFMPIYCNHFPLWLRIKMQQKILMILNTELLLFTPQSFSGDCHRYVSVCQCLSYFSTFLSHLEYICNLHLVHFMQSVCVWMCVSVCACVCCVPRVCS